MSLENETREEKAKRSHQKWVDKQKYYSLTLGTKFDKVIALKIPVDSGFDYMRIKPIYISSHLYTNTAIIKQLLKIDVEPGWIKYLYDDEDGTEWKSRFDNWKHF